MSHDATLDMPIDRITRLIRSQAADIQQRGVTSLYIYGSRARGDNRPDSDLDVFVNYDADSSFSLLELARIKGVLESATGLDVHITTGNSIPDACVERIRREAVKVI